MTKDLVVWKKLCLSTPSHSKKWKFLTHLPVNLFKKEINLGLFSNSEGSVFLDFAIYIGSICLSSFSLQH